MNIVYKDDIILAQKQLHALTIIDINQKLSIYDNKLSIDETNEYLQPVVRFFLNQNRHSIYLFLENVLGKYINDIVAFKRCNFVTSYEIESRKEVTIAVNLFLNQSKMGFLNLKQTYPDYVLLHKLLDNFSQKIKKHYINDFAP